MSADDAVATTLRAASDACHAAPDRAESHYAYGEAWLAAGEPARAEPAFATALRLAPGWADAWVNYGVARYRQGAIDDAKAAMRQALIRQPGHAAATANLGAFLRITGEGEAAEALLREALAAAPDNIGARLNLVADLLSEERAADALALLDEAHAPQDAQAERYWHLHRSPCCNGARPTRRRPASMRSPGSGRSRARCCPTSTGGRCCWRSAAAMGRRHGLRRSRRRPRSPTWGRRNIGREGAFGLFAAMYSRVSFNRCIVQLHGPMVRCRIEILAAEFRRDERVRDLFVSYSETLLSQVQQTVACNALHTAEEKMCRWLLMMHDRAEGEYLVYTHEFLAHMLGANRKSITLAAQSLQAAGLISYRRGKMQIIDRPGMEKASCECYAIVKERFDAFLAPPSTALRQTAGSRSRVN